MRYTDMYQLCLFVCLREIELQLFFKIPLTRYKTPPGIGGMGQIIELNRTYALTRTFYNESLLHFITGTYRGQVFLSPWSPQFFRFSAIFHRESIINIFIYIE